MSTSASCRACERAACDDAERAPYLASSSFARALACSSPASARPHRSSSACRPACASPTSSSSAARRASDVRSAFWTSTSVPSWQLCATFI
eukprot:6968191-Prymnesium_polylepis.1